MRISVPAPGALRHGNRAAEPFDDVLGDRQAEAGAAALGREVGIEDVREVGRRRCRRRGRRSTMRTRSPSRRVVERHERLRRPRPAAAGRRCGLVHRVARVDEQVDERDAQPLGVGRDRAAAPDRGRSAIGGAGPDACAAAADSRQSALRSAGASSKRIGRAKSSTSLTMRFSRATSSSMSATASRTAAAADVRLPQRVQRPP